MLRNWLRGGLFVGIAPRWRLEVPSDSAQRCTSTVAHRNAATDNLTCAVTSVCKTPLKQLEAFADILHRRAAPGRFIHTKDDPHAVRRLRHRPWPNFGQEMRPLQYTLLWARMPETALARGWP